MGDRAEHFSFADIEFGEALIRVSAHLDNALATYRGVDTSGALVHANRSLELMPQISRELWRHPELATALNRAAGAVASAIRSRRSGADVERALESYDRLSAESVGTAVGAATSPAYRGSVVVALLRTAAAAHDAGVREDATAILRRARSLSATLWGGAISPDELDQAFEALDEAMRAAPGADLRDLVSQMGGILHEQVGAVLDPEPSPRDVLEHVAELLDGARDAAAGGDRFRADKLIGQAYVEGYAQVRDSLGGWADESELDELIGRRLRLALAEGQPIDELVERARGLLASAPV